MLKKMLVFLSLSLVVAGTSFAGAGEPSKDAVAPAAQSTASGDDRSRSHREIPEQVTVDHWAHKAVVALQEKYGAAKTLPEQRPCSRQELLDALLATLRNVRQKYDQVGPEAVSRDDIASIRNLVAALEDDLVRSDSYREIRRSIEQILSLVEPEGTPDNRYKIGLNGFLRGEGQSNFNIPEASYRPGHDEGRFVYRVKPFGAWHPNEYLDIHLEGQGYGFLGSNRERGTISLYQGYLEAKLPRSDAAEKSWIAVKAGRQEINYGSAFILGSDTFFNGLAFDAVRVRLQPALPYLSLLTVDLLEGRYAAPSSDGVKGNLAGVYASYEPAESTSIEAYALRDTGSIEHHSGEHRDTYGFRSTGAVGILKMEYEGAYQSGRLFNGQTGVNDRIEAFGGHAELTGEFKVGHRDNSVFIGFAYGSGDKNAVNGLNGTREFANPNNDNSLVGDMGVIGDFSGLDAGDHHASGLRIYTLGWGIDLPAGSTDGRKLNFSATGRKFVAGSVEDGFSRDLGVETDFTLTYALDNNYSLILGYDRFFTGKFFRDATGSGKDIDYGYAMFVFNYDWTKRTPWKR